MAAEGLPCATPCRELDKHHLMESLPGPGGRDHDHCIPILQMETLRLHGDRWFAQCLAVGTECNPDMSDCKLKRHHKNVWRVLTDVQ